MTDTEIVIKGGHVIDPATGLDGRANILIKAGKISAIADDIKANNTARTPDIWRLCIISNSYQIK